MKAIILAAGKGKRMNSDVQKVMHPVLGKPMVKYVADAAKDAGCDDITVVIGKDGDEIREYFKDEGIHFAVQNEPLGTGHAVQAGAGRIENDDEVLILYGDMPLVTGEFIRELVKFEKDNFAEAVVAAVYQPQICDFGRVYDDNGYFIEIVESRDLKNHPHTDWANTGIYLFKGASLLRGLSQLKNNNSQKEFYLTDVPKILSEDGKNVQVFHSRADMSVFTGINTQAHLAEATAHMRTRINARHMANGVRMIDPASTFIDDGVKIAGGVVIYPNVIMEGACKIAENVTILANSFLRDASVGANSSIGPFAYLRPNAAVGENCRIGNFVEIKNAALGNNTRAAHLAYIGDADVGENVNFGCGAITVNYDGTNKHRTVIRNNAFIGSNVNLIAPVEIGADAVVAAGSTMTDDLPPCALGIARERQCVKENYKNK
jgi:bifunctional UDP-N-acetylglucosamine pyrophosphorylase/glucosamine-1-phosphate N-acetyltransferase